MLGELDLAAVDLVALLAQRLGDVGGGDGAEELALVVGAQLEVQDEAVELAAPRSRSTMRAIFLRRLSMSAMLCLVTVLA